jgi:hypothetical protein
VTFRIAAPDVFVEGSNDGLGQGESVEDCHYWRAFANLRILTLKAARAHLRVALWGFEIPIVHRRARRVRTRR